MMHLSALLFYIMTWACTAIDPAPKIDGQQASMVTVQENVTHRFSCQSEGWTREAPPLLTWYLNGERQSEPEILRVDAHYSETSDPGLALILFALVRSNPPATISWVDQSGQLVANSSDFLILDSRSFPWLANHSLQVTLSSLSGNLSLNASNSVGSAHSNLTLTEFLQSRVEVPVFGIVTGGVAGFITLLIFTLMVFFLIQKDKTKAIEEPAAVHLSSSRRGELVQVQVNGVYLPRENMSLPSHVQLNDDRALCKGQQNTLERRRGDEDEEDLSAAYAARGFARYPMVGYIYKVSSTSSDEIWL